ncbi:MAG: hypothetical protein F2587_02070 [Actinobacteria bacterium]|uniref:Unannotated protein n=1 Tax=freshwater metagenome TaxID=449393 RepID=A0A6J6H6T5_9ZZZZ|nr:hypothetical protein [Actinomycetota bacterium]
MSRNSNESVKLPKRFGPLSRVSRFFYAKSNLITALIATAVFVGYLLFALTAQGKAFAVADSAVKSLGTSLGFGQTEILAFLSERSDQMISAYVNFNLVWDTLFGLIYGVMYAVWVSVLFKSNSQRFGILNLLPFGQVIFDWLENVSLAALSNQYLAEGTVSSSTALLASTFSATKWVFSLLTYLVILVGIVIRIRVSLKRRSQR